ncbi:MAG: hypothetical protein JW981_08355 [Anaerolineae bacterium]|nr:hypothetical protein [Anaerolineae bacterium]
MLAYKSSPLRLSLIEVSPSQKRYRIQADGTSPAHLRQRANEAIDIIKGLVQRKQQTREDGVT